MIPEPAPKGAVLQLDTTGMVTEVIADELGLPHIPPPFPFPDLVDPANRQKAENFLRAMEVDPLALQWQINVPKDDGVQTLEFTGIRHGDNCSVFVAENIDDLMALNTELLRINSRQATMLRKALKERALLEQARVDDGCSVEELGRLNNELVNMQRELTAKNQQLARLNEEKNYLMGVTAHDLRNPMANIVSASRMLEEELQAMDSELCMSLAGVISRSSEHLLTLISDLLDYTKIESGKVSLNKQPTDLAELFTGHQDMILSMAARKGISFRLINPEGMPEVLVDPHKILQVFDNLTSNAVKFSSRGDTVSATLEYDEACIRLTVADTGPGIPEDEREQLFRPFARISVRPSGGETSSGLGLSIVHRIVTSHGGAIAVDSAPGQGTTFVVTLPRS